MILVTGANGQLGGDVCDVLSAQGKAVLGVDVDSLDITDADAVAAFFGDHPEIDSVIHCAAYTAVDQAEDDPDRCFAVNVDGTANLAKNAAGCKFLYVSTDYVFGADDREPLEIDTVKEPACVYGKSKLLGEVEVQKACEKYFIVRTSGVFGEKNRNFIATILRLSEIHDALRVVKDQIGSPTYSRDLAALLAEMITTESYGIYHAANTGYCSWAFLAETVLRLCGKPTEVIPIFSEDYPAKARRPRNSRFSFRSLDEAGFARLRPWKEAVKEYLGGQGLLKE